MQSKTKQLLLLLMVRKILNFNSPPFYFLSSIQGASVNLGKKNGLGVLFARALGKENSLIIHHCSAHRDQLVFQNSMEKHSDFVRLEKEVNGVYKVSEIPL